ncbi:hypothetical protein IQ238_16750 [Pleurocapsales cyanobacterium LEGE 06147]|nr:hypothetical protein [Pleurocapsales cyanobacterium LEGE 06147]
MTKLASEGLPRDGSFQMHKILSSANKRLDKLGKHGKRAKLKQSGNSISLQFNFKGQQQKGCGIGDKLRKCTNCQVYRNRSIKGILN